MSKLKSTYRRKESELKTKVTSLESQLHRRNTDFVTLKKLYGDLQAELETAHKYIEQLASAKTLRQISPRASGSSDGIEDDTHRSAIAATRDGTTSGSSASADAKQELSKLRSEVARLQAELTAREARVNREAATSQARMNELESQHLRVVEMNETLNQAQTEVARVTKLLESERAMASRAREEASTNSGTLREKIAHLTGEKRALVEQHEADTREQHTKFASLAASSRSCALRLLGAGVTRYAHGMLGRALRTWLDAMRHDESLILVEETSTLKDQLAELQQEVKGGDCCCCSMVRAGASCI